MTLLHDIFWVRTRIILNFQHMLPQTQHIYILGVFRENEKTLQVKEFLHWGRKSRNVCTEMPGNIIMGRLVYIGIYLVSNRVNQGTEHQFISNCPSISGLASSLRSPSIYRELWWHSGNIQNYLLFEMVNLDYKHFWSQTILNDAIFKLRYSTLY